MKHSSLLIILFLMTFFSCTEYNTKNKYSEQDKIIREHTKIFNDKEAEYNKIFQKSISIRYIATKNNKVLFKAKNNTKYAIKHFAFRVLLFDAYGQEMRHQNYVDVRLSFDAVNPDNIIMSGEEIELSWNYAYIKDRFNYGTSERDLWQDFELDKYKDVMNLKGELKYLSLLNYKSFKSELMAFVYHKSYYGETERMIKACESDLINIENSKEEVLNYLLHYPTY